MINRTISHYTILEKIGEGGMGVVYLATDLRLDRKVAIKFLPRHFVSDEKGRKRFDIEAKAAAALNHPNISTIYGIEEIDSPEWGSETCIVMEYIEGRDLSEVIEESHSTPVAEETIRQYALQIARGLAAAHARGIVHRDIKSKNILVTHDGQVKIMDFGLAKIQGGEQVTKSGTTVGTAAYMSPEQIEGKEVDERSDIWSFGIILFELLTGTRPFQGAYEQSLFYSIVNAEPPAVASMSTVSSPVLERVVKRCLAKKPADRYQSMTDVLNDIAVTGERYVTPGDVERTKVRAFRPKSLWRRLVTAGAAALVIIAGFILTRMTGSWPWQSDIPEEQHLVVLPLTNVGADPEKQPFCDGLLETLTSKLTQMEQFNQSLWVVPASEVRRNNITSAGEAHASFGANLVVTGSLQLLNDVFRLSLNLIDAKNLRQLNSAVIDVKATNLAALQNESVSKLLDMMNRELNPQARELIDAGTTTVPGAYEFYLQGVGYLQRFEDERNIDAAISVFRHAIGKDSAYALARAGLAEAYWRKYLAAKDNRWVTLAMDEVDRAVHLNSDLPEVNVTRGMIQSGTGHYDEALHDFQRALDEDATNPSAYGGLARTYEITGKLEQAELTYQKAISLKPDYWAGYNDLGVFYFKHNRYDDAIRQFQQVISLTPDNDRGFSNLGGIYYLLKRWPEARRMFERALALHKTVRVCSNLGTLYYIQGEYVRAAHMYEEALALNDNDYRVWGNLAAAYYWSPDRRDTAMACYRHAIALAEKQKEVNPSDPDLLSQLGGYYSMVGSNNIARSHIERALAIAPSDAEVMFRAGTAFEQMGDRTQALHWIGKALNNGYPLSEIEHQPELDGLRKDRRYTVMARNASGATTQ